MAATLDFSGIYCLKNLHLITDKTAFPLIPGLISLPKYR